MRRDWGKCANNRKIHDKPYEIHPLYKSLQNNKKLLDLKAAEKAEDTSLQAAKVPYACHTPLIPVILLILLILFVPVIPLILFIGAYETYRVDPANPVRSIAALCRDIPIYI